MILTFLITGFVKDWCYKKNDEPSWVRIPYYIHSAGMLAWWIMGLYWRFNEEGRFVCAEVVPT